MPARRILAVAVATSAVVLAAPAAWAYFGLHVAAPVSATAGVLDKPGALDVTLEPGTPSGLQARISWTAPDADPGDDTKANDDAAYPDGFLVERQAALGSDAWETVAGEPQCGVDAAAGGAVRCTLVDALPADGDTVAYRYRVRSLRGAHWESDPTAARLVASIAPDAARVGAGDYDLTDLAASPDGSGLVAVGSGGTVLACLGNCGDGAVWTPVASGTNADLVDVSPAASGDGLVASNADGADVECATACGTTSGAWAPAPSSDAPATDGAAAPASDGDPVSVEHRGRQWRLVPGDPPKVQRWDGDRWVDQDLPSPVGDQTLQAPDQDSADLGVLPADTDLGGEAGCPDAALHASVQLPDALSSPLAALSVQVDYRFFGGDELGSLALLASTDGGTSWSHPVVADPAEGGLAVLSLTDATGPATAQGVTSVGLCLAGVGGATALHVDAVRLLVDH